MDVVSLIVALCFCAVKIVCGEIKEKMNAFL